MQEIIAGKYEALEEMSASAAGTTHKVRHVLLDALCSLTVVSPTAEQRPQVEDAVRRAYRLRHDHIVPVLDFGREADRYQVVEAFVEAEPLDRVLREAGPLPRAEALHVARQLAAALGHAHENGVVHGAISPASIRVQRGIPPRAMFSGFGAAVSASLDPAALRRHSAPERLAGHDVDARSDIFTLGLLIFEMFEGEPFLPDGEDEIRALLLHGTEPLMPRFSRIAPTGVSALVARAIRRSPAQRQQSMAQLQSEIDACLRRLGETGARVRGAASVDSPVRRAGIVVDDALLEPGDEADDEPEPARNAAPRAVRRPALATGILAAAGVLVLAWPLVHAAGPMRAALKRVGLAADAPVDPSSAAAASAVPPAPAIPAPAVAAAEPQAPAPSAPPPAVAGAGEKESERPWAAVAGRRTKPVRSRTRHILRHRPRGRAAVKRKP